MLVTDSTCPICSGVMSEIDQYGERLVGCMKCIVGGLRVTARNVFSYSFPTMLLRP